jgi:predicted MFS family arabinose efflux permease
MVGPLIAAALLNWAGMDLRTVFLFAAIPGALSVIVVLATVRDKPTEAAPKPRTSLLAGWSELGSGYKTYLLALLVFTLGGSTDAFLLLQLGHAGLSGSAIAVTWAVFHGVKTVVSLAGGRMTDRFGARTLMIAGWFFYAAVYVAFSYQLPPAALVTVFILYGAYYGLTEPAERAWVTHLVPAHRVGTGFGFFHGVVGLTALPASIVFGLLWQAYGSQVAFLTGAGLALGGALLLTRVPVRTA